MQVGCRSLSWLAALRRESSLSYPGSAGSFSYERLPPWCRVSPGQWWGHKRWLIVRRLFDIIGIRGVIPDIGDARVGLRWMRGRVRPALEVSPDVIHHLVGGLDEVFEPVSRTVTNARSRVPRGVGSLLDPLATAMQATA